MAGRVAIKGANRLHGLENRELLSGNKGFAPQISGECGPAHVEFPQLSMGDISPTPVGQRTCRTGMKNPGHLHFSTEPESTATISGKAAHTNQILWLQPVEDCPQGFIADSKECFPLV